MDLREERHPGRRVREVYAEFDGSSITVYQAYSADIADAALEAGTFVAPFKMERMTWIKPSFTWMMYRCGYAAKVGQTRVLAVRISREGWEWALRRSSPSHHDRAVHETTEEWQDALRLSAVRVQWDPERDLHLHPLDHRSIQVGLGRAAVRHYVNEWITGIEDVTERAHRVHELVRAKDLDAAARLSPTERRYPLPDDVTAVVGATPVIESQGVGGSRRSGTARA